MRVKLFLALAIASVILLCSTGAAAASALNLCDITGTPTAADLTAAAEGEISAFGFPDLSGVNGLSENDLAMDETNDALSLESPICGVCGEIPPCSCEETLTTIPGPQVNLGCPTVGVEAVPVNLVSPVIRPTFPTINVAPQAIVRLPQVNTQLNCFDIECLPVTNINSCPVIDC